MDAFYFPGKLVGTEEEFISGGGTYTEDGKIYSSTTGGALIGSDRRVNVKAAVPIPSLVKPGMTVYGRVEEIFEPIALVRLEPVESSGIRQSSVRMMSVLHVSRIRSGYARSIRDWIRIGDIVKARVEDVARGEVNLSVKDNNFGVIKAFCSRCRSPLVLKERNLECASCGSKEIRKLSSDYGTVRI